MKADKRTLTAVKKCLEEQEGYDINDFKEQLLEDVDMLHTKSMGKVLLSSDECGIEWDKEEICVLSDFLDAYTQRFIERICYFLDSFIDTDIE